MAENSRRMTCATMCLSVHGTVDCNGTHRLIFGDGMRVRNAKTGSRLHIKALKNSCSDTMPERSMEEHQNQMQQHKLDRSHDQQPRQNLMF